MRWHPTLEEISHSLRMGVIPLPPKQTKTDLAKLAHIFATLCACEKAFRELGAEYTEIDGVPIKDWIADAKADFAS